MQQDRRAELESRLRAVEQRIDDATRAAGRSEKPQLIVVTKFFPATDVALLADAGVKDVGENREQEAAPKARELQDAHPDLRWHFVGQLQSNKASRVARFAHAVHSVDRASLVKALSKAMRARQDEEPAVADLKCFLQIDLRSERSAQEDPSAPRGGAAPSQMLALADAVAGAEGLALEGLMAVAPLGEDPAPAFDRLAALSQRLREQHPGAAQISAGMSADLEQAVAAGATRLRVGSDILGPRPALR